MFRQFVHTHLWRSIPKSLRRRALVQGTALAAPRPDRTARPAQPIVVAGFLTAATGLGQSARLCIEALRAEGVPVFGIDLSDALRQGGGEVPFAFEDGRSQRGLGTLILHVNAPFTPLALMMLGRAFVRRKFVIGYWAWELARAPEEWRAGLPFVHQVMTPSRFVRDAIKALDPSLSVGVLPHPVAANRALPALTARVRGQFTVLQMFNAASSVARKNPLAGVEAFKRAFGDSRDARLVIKAQNLMADLDAARALDRAIEGHANISLLCGTSEPNDVARLQADSDVILSLHRAEGFGLVVAEAMLAGRVAVATDYSGTTDFLDDRVGCPIPYSLVPAIDPGGEYHCPDQVWADADVNAAAEALRRLAADRDLTAGLGRAARSVALAHFSPAAYVATLSEALEGRSARDHVDDGRHEVGPMPAQ